MIFVCAFLTAIVIAIVAGITIFLHPTKLAKQIVIGAIILAVIFGIVCLIGMSVVKHEIIRVQDTYDDLMLYYYTVETSTNEYLRYDYYNKVNEYNECYNELVARSKSPVENWFFDTAVLDKLDTISFTLHGDGYNAEG